MKPVVVTGPPRPPADVVSQLGSHGVATVHEAMGRLGLLGSQLRPLWPGGRAAGSAVTALCPPGDNLTVHLAVEQVAPGDMLVVTTTSHSLDGYILYRRAARHRAGGPRCGRPRHDHGHS